MPERRKSLYLQITKPHMTKKIGFANRSSAKYCRGLTRAIYILSIEHLRMTCLSRESNPGPPALQANTLWKEPFERPYLVAIRDLTCVATVTHLRNVRKVPHLWKVRKVSHLRKVCKVPHLRKVLTNYLGPQCEFAICVTSLQIAYLWQYLAKYVVCADFVIQPLDLSWHIISFP